MPTGVSGFYRPTQSEPASHLELDNSYFLIKLFDAQAFFSASWFSRARYLILDSSIESSFLPGSQNQSLYKITLLKKNDPCHLGVSPNLTDWLPARATDTIKVSINYRVMRGTVIKTLINALKQIDRATKLSVLQPKVAVAVNVTGIVGNLLSTILQEGKLNDVFTLTGHLNLADVKSGYYVAIGSQTDEMWLSKLRIDANGHLVQSDGRELSRYSYAVIQVLALKRLGLERLREESWGELLQAGKDRALGAVYSNDEERNKGMQEWYTTLSLVRLLARKDRSYLQTEVDAIIASIHLEVEAKLLPRTVHEITGLDSSYPDKWQEVLGFSTPQELHHAVRDYQDALKLSDQLKKQYNIRNGE